MCQSRDGKQNFYQGIFLIAAAALQKLGTKLSKGVDILKRKTAIRAISFLTVAVVVLGILSAALYDKSVRCERQNQASYQRAFGELVTGFSQLNAALEKSCYATSPELASAMCTEVFGKAMTAQMALSCLPYSSQELENTAGFISQVGDYALYLSRSSAAGTAFTQEELDNLDALSQTAQELSVQLQNLQLDLADGVLSMEAQEDTQAHTDALAAQGEESASLGGSMKTIESEFPEIPTLIYDGPFSQHKEGLSPKALEGLEDVDAETARKSAADFLGLRTGRVSLTGESEGSHLPCYYFTAKRDRCSCQVEVSKAGGKVVSLLCGRQVGERTLSAEEAVDIAQNFLERQGYTGMRVTYHMIHNNILTANFAYEQDGVLYYPDLIKVSIALDNGSLAGFDAEGYLTSHTDRQALEAAVTQEEAAGTVSPQLEVLRHQLAVIPTDGENEKFCHEFLCQNDRDAKYLVYVNAETGRQERILILLEDENGTLTL